MKTLNNHTVILELHRAVKKLRKKYPQAKYIGSNISVYSAEWENNDTLNYVQISVHHDELTNNCVVSSKPTVPECLTDIHNQLKGFAHLLK